MGQSLVVFLIIVLLSVAVFFIFKNEFSHKKTHGKDSGNNVEFIDVDSNIFRKKVSKKNNQESEIYSYSTPVFISIIGMLTRIAKSDGAISTQEAGVISAAIDNFVNSVQSEIRKQLINSHNESKKDNQSMSRYAKNLAHKNLDFKIEVVKQLITIATINGYTKAKESLIYEAGESLGLAKPQIDKYVDAVIGVQQREATTLLNPYEVLNCKKSDDFAMIKKQYRMMTTKYHPDYIQAKNLDESFIEFANKKMQEVNEAYDRIRKERGF